jgi:hypothetical protein
MLFADIFFPGVLAKARMIVVQQSEASAPSLASPHALYTKVVSDKHEDPMARFGATIGQGFIDAGDRNVTISLQSEQGVGIQAQLLAWSCSVNFGTGTLWPTAHVWLLNLPASLD